MTHHRPAPLLRSGLVCAATLLLLALLPAPSRAAATAVTLDVHLDHGNWVPLAAETMTSATRDAAISRISEGGWLRISPKNAAGIEGSLVVDVTLVSKAQIAKAVMTLEVPGEATYVSNASISVKGLDAQGFHRAFEHVGREAADRLHSMMAARRGGAIEVVDDLDDAHWRDTFNEAQAKKHASDWAESRILFERVANASGPGTQRLAEMATDELRYGLPVMQARQTLVGSSGPGAGGQFMTNMNRVEALYRQIQAENPTNVARIQESQQALDTVVVYRHAFAQAQRSQVIMRVSQLRMMMTEHVMMEGSCPDGPNVEEMVGYGPFELEVGRISNEGDGAASYSITDVESGISIPIACNRRGVEVDLTAVQARRAPPASR